MSDDFEWVDAGRVVDKKSGKTGTMFHPTKPNGKLVSMMIPATFVKWDEGFTEHVTLNTLDFEEKLAEKVEVDAVAKTDRKRKSRREISGWTEEETKKLVELSPTHSASQISAIIGRSAIAIQKKRNALGLFILNYERNQDGAGRPSKLKEEDVIEIRKMLKKNIPIHRIATKYGVADPTIKSIKSGKTWTWLK